ncbi:VanZ family protein [Bradyrhizobium jicamae]|nr:VanZ family protein [Bradyrhizobium jicamae]
MRTLGVIAGWLALLLIACVTLSPIQDRPSLAGAQLERFVAFATMGLAFVLGYPRRTLLIVLFVVGSAFMLEAMQLLTPDRHGRLIDAIVKAAGGTCGIATGRLVLLYLRGKIERLRARAEQSAG